MKWNPTVAWDLLKTIFNEWNEDNAPRLGAAVAYYTVFSIAPLVIIAIAMAGLVFGEQAAHDQIVGQIEGVVGKQMAEAVQGMLKSATGTKGGTWATVIGIIVFLFGASGVFVELQGALNTVWKVEPKPGRALRAMVRERLISFLVVLGIGLLLLASLVVSAALSALGKLLPPDSQPGGLYLWQTINNLVSLGFVTILFALLFKLLPDVKIAWRDVWAGAFLAALLFTIGKYLLGLYLGRSATLSAYGAAGSLVVMLLWVYYSAQIFLFGAEFTRVYAYRNGSPPVAAENALPIPCDDGIHSGTFPPPAASSSNPATAGRR